MHDLTKEFFQGIPFVCRYERGQYKKQPHNVKVGFLLSSAPDRDDLIWTPSISLLDQMADWCQETTGTKNSIFSRWSYLRNQFSFEDKSLALAFIVAWDNCR